MSFVRRLSSNENPYTLTFLHTCKDESVFEWDKVEGELQAFLMTREDGLKTSCCLMTFHLLAKESTPRASR